MCHQISEDDQRFRASVETCTIPVTEFNHLAHVRLAYIYLAESDVDEANRQLREVLTRLLKHNNIKEPLKKVSRFLFQAFRWLKKDQNWQYRLLFRLFYQCSLNFRRTDPMVSLLTVFF